MAEKILALCNVTNELGEYVARLKDKSEKALQWKELDAADTVADFPRLTFTELSDLTLGELKDYLMFPEQ